jgi:hypothetical protein
MKILQEKKLTLNESLSAAYELWETGQDEKMVRLAINARLMVFQEQPHVLISSANGRCV